jgi:putative peptide zinc metalloprotease protein
MRIRNDVCYKVNYTLSGKILLVGIKGLNSFVKLNREYVTPAIEFIDRYKNEEIEENALEPIDRKLYKNFNRAGFLENEIEPKASFNEFKQMGKVLLTIHPSDRKILPAVSDQVKVFVFIVSVICMLGYMYRNIRLAPSVIDYQHMKLWEIVFTIGVYPWAVLALHEMGHCFQAKMFGVKIQSISIGWFYIYPLVLVQYWGLNLEKQTNKILIMLGGIYANLVLAFLGFVLKSVRPDIFQGAVTDIWIMANISTIITNLGLMGMTDGYFIVSSLIGIMNLRLKGYRCIGSVLNRKRVTRPEEKICGIVLFGMFLSGLYSLYLNITYWLNLFMVPVLILRIVFMGLAVFLFFRFMMRIRNVQV